MELRTLIVAVVVAFGASALVSQITFRSSASSTATPAPEVATAAAGTGYAALLDQLDRGIENLQRRASKRSDDWLTRQYLGNLLLERAGLTNRLEDFVRLEALLDDSFAIAPKGAGPSMLAARFNFTIHRLDVAERHLETIDRRPVPMADEQLLARALRAEIAVQRGQYEAAFAELTAVAAVAPQIVDTTLALYHARTGDPLKADALLADALESTSEKDVRRRAWIMLQRGIMAMDRGELMDALKHLRDADAELSGWWLVQEHIAEVYSRLGNHDKAIAIYEQMVPQTGLPQHKDALASLYRHTGKPQEADELIAQAAATWERQLARFPEAAMGHALQHHLQFGAPQRALELALANHAARPGGDAQVALARAHLKAGQPAEALAVVERALASPYRTARLHDVAAQAHAALGHTREADEQVARCKALNPWYSSDDHSH
jgi:tetratricopeptide (TPR) repeat protein